MKQISGQGHVGSQLMQNKASTDSEQEVADADYNKFPLEHYGLALLRGMGYVPGTNSGVKPVEVVPRQKGAGLGASQNDKSYSGTNTSVSDDGSLNDLVLKRGAHCRVKKGPSEGLYATIDGLDEDNSRVIVRFAVNQKVATLSRQLIFLVSSREFDRHVQKLEQKKAERRDIDVGSTAQRSNDAMKGSDSRSRTHQDEADEKSKTSHSKHKDVPLSNGKSCWLRPHLKVKVTDPQYAKGSYYKHKVIIEDITTPGYCTCRTRDGHLLEDLHQSQLETVVPHQLEEHVMVVNGKHQNQIGTVIENNRDKYRAVIQLISDRDKLLTLDYDDICEYTADVSHLFDY